MNRRCPELYFVREHRDEDARPLVHCEAVAAADGETVERRVGVNAERLVA